MYDYLYIDGFRKNQSFFYWILITNCLFEFDHIHFSLDTFHTESEALPQGVFGVFSYYQLVMLFLNMVCLTLALACTCFHRKSD
jgi:hypothetical protein